MPIMHRAIIYDLDGVIRLWEPTALADIEKRHGLPLGVIAAAAFEPALALQATCGHIDDDGWRLAVKETLVRAHGPAGTAAVADWCLLTGRVNSELISLVAELRPRWRTGLLTNATTRVEADLEQLGLTGCFDVVMNSARLGLAKPDPRVFRAAADRLGHQPEECIFVDDTPVNVEAARATGLTGIVYIGVGDLRERLAPLLAG